MERGDPAAVRIQNIKRACQRLYYDIVKARVPVDFLKLGRYKFQLKEIPLQLKQLDVNTGGKEKN